MLSTIARRLLALIPILIGLSLIVFLIMALIPGDPALAILGSYATPESLTQPARRDGARSPAAGAISHLARQYSSRRFWALVQSQSAGARRSRRAVSRDAHSFDAAFALCSIWGVLAGVVCAVRQNSWVDRIVTLLVLIGISIPSFWLGLLLILLFAVRLQWLPASGMFAIYGGGDLLDLARHLVLPATTLSVVATGVIARLTRASMLEVLRQDYIRTARAKGVAEGSVIFRHAFKAALVNITPVLGVQAGFVLGGAVYVETIFQWPGIGRMLVTAISTRDILLVQGGVLVVAASYVLFNLIADVVQHLLDPRVRT